MRECERIRWMVNEAGVPEGRQRAVAMYLARDVAGLKYEAIAAAFSLHKSSVIRAVHRVRDFAWLPFFENLRERCRRELGNDAAD